MSHGANGVSVQEERVRVGPHPDPQPGHIGPDVKVAHLGHPNKQESIRKDNKEMTNCPKVKNCEDWPFVMMLFSLNELVRKYLKLIRLHYTAAAASFEGWALTGSGWPKQTSSK